MDTFKDHARATVSTGYDASATSIVLTTGHGANLPTVFPYIVTWWNFTDYAVPSDDPNVEEAIATAISTDTLTVTRTSGKTHNTGGKTYKMIAGLTAKSLNTDLYAILGNKGVLFPKATIKNGFVGNLGTGDIDLYTCPTGKRALVTSLIYCNTSGSNVAYRCKVKIGATYYRLQTDNTAFSSFSGSDQNCSIILEDGEKFAINADTAGLNIWVCILEFDATSPLKSVKMVNLVTGNNTLYTVPTGKQAIILDASLSLAITGSVNYLADAGGTRVFIPYLVPNGSSAGSTNQAAVSASVPASSVGSKNIGNVLNAGDFVVVNVDTGAAAQLARLGGVIEI